MTDEKFIDVDGIRTRYFEKGTGPVVVLFMAVISVRTTPPIALTTGV